MSDVGWDSLVQIATIAAPVLLAVIAVIQSVAVHFAKRAEVAAKHAAEKAAEAAGKVAEVAETLVVSGDKTDGTLSEIKKIAVETHTLTNSALGLNLANYALKCRELANHTKTEAHKKDAELAEAQLREHQERQRVVDAENKRLRDLVSQAASSKAATLFRKPTYTPDKGSTGGT